MNERQFEMAAQLAERDREEAIQAAARRVEAEGRIDCEDCEERIPLQRRLAAPWATRCMDCQAAHELAQHHFFNRFF